MSDIPRWHSSFAGALGYGGLAAFNFGSFAVWCLVQWCFQEALKCGSDAAAIMPTRATDIFMLGVAIYIVWTEGMLPFCDTSSYDGGDAVLEHKQNVLRLRRQAPNLDRIDNPMLRHLLQWCMSHKAKLRPSADQVRVVAEHYSWHASGCISCTLMVHV